ncbi:MAG: TPR repeat-containing protein YfgC precursor [Spirochaetes bacterium ADurb.Bin110]|nr:MAG: TPR repeat-containing protein YfgC precursor [Spirochaetes bacterium ADurb.Bin110]
MRKIALQSRALAVIFALILTIPFLGSCAISPESLQFFLEQAILQGMITPEQSRLILEAVRSFQVESEPFTYEEEYAIGRVVTAAVLSQYQVYEQPELTAYINKIGQGLAFYSARPCLPQGYHILILDSEEAHAFAAPGGFILITRGLLKLAGNEDMLAALLAHEISHTALGHGLLSLSSYRMGDLAKYYVMLSAESAQAYNKEAMEFFSAAVHDFVSLISVQGYSQVMEFEADAEAMRMLYEANYRPSALGDFVVSLENAKDECFQQYSMQHPLADDRLSRIASLNQYYSQQAELEHRKECAKQLDSLSWIEEESKVSAYPASELSFLDSECELGDGRLISPVSLELLRRGRFEAIRPLF